MKKSIITAIFISLVALGSFAFSSDEAPAANDDCCPIECCILGD